ncbi:MAG: hypothetical protein JWN07_3358 [Hyphomicrobiales bacterium]|nr:hypothetical protein [Hyphomicrobiales bacterium]
MLPAVDAVHCKQGSFLLFRTNDYITAHLRTSGEWEPFLVSMSELLLRGGESPLVLDIGANLGAYAIPLAKAIQQSGGAIFAFEPQRIIYYQLCGNIFLNSLDNVHAFHAALGDVSGDVQIPEMDYASNPNIGAFSLSPEFRLRATLGSISRQTYPVPMQKLDDLSTPRRVSLIKMDVEGHERQVLVGGRVFLRQHGFPPIIFEMWDRPSFAQERERLRAAFEELGYDLLQLDTTNFLAQHARTPVRISAGLRGEQRVYYRSR